MYNRDMQDQTCAPSLGDLVYWPAPSWCPATLPKQHQFTYLGVVVELGGDPKPSTEGLGGVSTAKKITYWMSGGGYWYTTVIKSMELHGGEIISRGSLKKPPFTKTQESAKHVKT